MLLFAIVAQDRPDAGTLRADTRPAHIAYIDTLMDRIVVAGPTLDETGASNGSIIVAEFADLAAARSFAAADPYAVAGLFAHSRVAAFRKVLPA